MTSDMDACEGIGRAVDGETLSSGPPNRSRRVVKCERIRKLRKAVGTAAVPDKPP
jgi:hypothetical protein